MRGRVALASAVVLCAVGGVVLGGDLNPPAGPVAPTMKSLEKIEPRTCVNMLPGGANAVHVINESGSYYLTADIIGEPGKHGILIDAGRVSIDLNGHSLRGAPGSLDGVHSEPQEGLVAVVIITGLTTLGATVNSTISDFDGDGIHAEGVSDLSVRGVTVENNLDDGLDALMFIPSSGMYEPYIALKDFVTRSNGGHGIRAVAPVSAGVEAKVLFEGVRSCMNGLDGVHVADFSHVRLRDVDVLSNGDDGVEAQVTARPGKEGFFDLARSQSIGNVGHGVSTRAGVNEAGLLSADKVSFADVTACGNGLDGFHDEGAFSARWERCSSAKNGAIGYYKVYQPGQPCYGNIVFIGSQGSENGSSGSTLLVPVDSDFNVTVHSSDFGSNGHSQGGHVGPGLMIDSSGGAPDPARLRSLGVTVTDTECSANSGDGLRIKTRHDVAMGSIRNIKARMNGGSGVDVGPADGAALFDIAVNFEDIFCSANAIDGIVVSGVRGGSITDCRTDKNGGVGLHVAGAVIPGGAVLSSAVRIDQCMASYNSVGISVDGENFVVRSGGTHNTMANMSLGPAVFAGPSVASPAWIETKPYTWP